MNATHTSLSVLALYALSACRPADTERRVADATPPATTSPVDASALAACATGDSLLRRLPTLAQRRPAAVPFDSIWHDEAGRWACQLSAAGNLKGMLTPVDSVVTWLKLRGFSDRSAISADGPDGTVLGLHRGNVTCVVRGAWDGGDDSDSTYVPSDTIEVHLACTRLLASDTAGLAPP